EVFTHRAAGVGGNVLHSSRFGCRGSHDDGVFQRAMLFELTHHVGDSGSLLTDSHVHAGDVLALLRDDGVHRDSRLTGLAVANDQLALAATDRHHGVDSLGTG